MSEPSPAAHTDSAVYYGRQTELARRHFPVSGRQLGDVPELISAYALVKAAAARANVRHGVLDHDRAEAIESAALEIAGGGLSDQFPLGLIQGGGGTSTNMNLNEVIAGRANELLYGRPGGLTVHPNDHVNASQSTNDTYPTAMALTLIALAARAVQAQALVRDTLDEQSRRNPTQRRLGRTCLQDAVTLTVDATHRGQAAGVERTRRGLEDSVRALRAVPLGATVLGTGVGAPSGFGKSAVAELAALSGHDLVASPDPFDALSNLDPYAAVGAGCVRAAIVLSKLAGDLRLLSSGPAGGLGEVTLPAMQAGSSIMPGKVNPVIPELVMQLGFRIRGSAVTVDLAVAAGELELNVMEPVIIDALVTCLRDLTEASDTFARYCLEGLRWNAAALAQHLPAGNEDGIQAARTAGYEAVARAVRDRTAAPR